MSDSDHDQDDHGYKKKKKKKQAWKEHVPVVVQQELEEPEPAEIVPEKKRKHSEDEKQEQAELPTVDATETRKQKKARLWNERKEREKAGLPPAVAGDGTSAANGEDWAARHLEKKRKKKERQAQLQLDEEAKIALKAKLDDKATREKANEKLKKKGKLTKKQKYLAAKAAKKAQSSGQKSQDFSVTEALATAGLEKLDPKAVSCFLTGLPYLATEKHIAAHFSDIGPCTVQIQKDESGRGDGRGFVTFTAAEHALQASTYTGSTIQGRWIKIRLCEPRESGASNTNQGPGEKPEGCLSVVVKCDKSISEASLKRFFADCEVANVSRMMDRETGEFRGTAFMDFEDTRMVDKAVAMNGQTIKGTEIRVRYKMDNKKGGVQEGSSQQEKKKTRKEAPKMETGRVAEHNRAPPVPKPTGKATTFDDSDTE